MFRHSDRRKVFDFGQTLVNIQDALEENRLLICELELKAAMYKAYFFNKTELAKKLDDQIMDNWRSCYHESWITYRTLDDMLADGLITKEEHEFCKV